MKQLILVEDDPSFGYILSEYLKMKGYRILWAKRGGEAQDLIEKEKPDLAILDVMLPDTTGFELADTIKTLSLATSFIFLTARDLKIDQLRGYQLGAEEYITKPVDEEVLVAKIEAILGRKGPAQLLPVLQYKGLMLFDKEQLLKVGEEQHKLSTRENDLLRMLMGRPGSLVGRQELLMQLWGATDEFSRKSMDVFISRLRKYLPADGSVQIRNVHGKGFVLE
jgi:DNA-binding response OmpR family regulator